MNKQILILFIAIACVAGIFFSSSCTKKCDTSNFRTKSYVDSVGLTGYSGSVTISEQCNNTTLFHVTIMGPSAGLLYDIHIHQGKAPNLGLETIDLGSGTPAGTTFAKDTTLQIKYDDMLTYDGCFVCHNPNGADTAHPYAVYCNIGKNAH